MGLISKLFGSSNSDVAKLMQDMERRNEKWIQMGAGLANSVLTENLQKGAILSDARIKETSIPADAYNRSAIELGFSKQMLEYSKAGYIDLFNTEDGDIVFSSKNSDYLNLVASAPKNQIPYECTHWLPVDMEGDKGKIGRSIVRYARYRYSEANIIVALKYNIASPSLMLGNPLANYLKPLEMVEVMLQGARLGDSPDGKYGIKFDFHKKNWSSTLKASVDGPNKMKWTSFSSFSSIDDISVTKLRDQLSETDYMTISVGYMLDSGHISGISLSMPSAENFVAARKGIIYDLL